MKNVNIGKVHRDAFRAVEALSAQAAADAREAGLAPTLIELVKVRASQINGCAYCLRLHSRDAISLGETPERLAVLAAWWESQYFSPVEQAALRLVEEVTLISDRTPLPDRGIVVAHALTDVQISAITWVAISINALNRVAITSHYPVGPAR
jgi:AhpD family alkylhydroperoxidase